MLRLQDLVFLTTYPLRLPLLWYKSLQQVDFFQHLPLELVSKELNHLAAILYVYAGGLNFMK